MNRLVIIIVTSLLIFSCDVEPKNQIVSGPIFGTSFSIQYYSDNNLDFEKQFDSLFYVINKSLSTYQTNSIISKINRNEIIRVDEHFIKVFEASKNIHKETLGAFDPTIGVLVNAWDFGPEGKVVSLDSLKIDSLKQYVGINKVTLLNYKIEKPNNSFIDFNAIAKGYTVDVIAEFLESKHIENYLVEIGGELRAQGINIEKRNTWKVGV